ncbi:PAS domain-containing protein [bacterium]|nr:PAS domain-containing protein [bacterium]
MKRPTLLSATLLPLLAILVTALVLVTALTGRVVREFVLADTTGRLRELVAVAAPRLAAAAAEGPEAIATLCRDLGAATAGVRFTVIAADGRVLGDSHERVERMDDHRDRPEVAAALAGNHGQSLRFSAARGERMLYVAQPVPTADGGRLALRAAVSLARLDAELRLVYREIALAGLVVGLLAAAVGYLRSRALGRAVGRLQAGAQAFAAGELGERLTVADTVEIAAVAEAMNDMAGQLGERLTLVERQRGELEAVLASMVEGVVAVDREENVIGLNAAGAALLGTTAERASGRSIQEVGRHPELTRLAQQVLAGAARLERDLQLGPGSETWLQVRASGLVDGRGERLGALLVLNNVTRLRRLETMRRDFVANVSHELKTPITSVKGFVETIIDEPPADEADLRRFLEIIRRQADRLDSIITDLLALSRLEQDADGGGIELAPEPLAPVLERVARDLAARRPEQADRVRLLCGGDVQARINAALLEQAVTNLLENALKYSPPGTPVTVCCRRRAGQVCIDVVDAGPGIAAEHLPRLFERFYRVDKARSRQLGGTGLGLAIVKHIAQAHGGRAEVASEPGRGSAFTIILPGTEMR